MGKFFLFVTLAMTFASVCQADILVNHGVISWNGPSFQATPENCGIAEQVLNADVTAAVQKISRKLPVVNVGILSGFQCKLWSDQSLGGMWSYGVYTTYSVNLSGGGTCEFNMVPTAPTPTAHWKSNQLRCSK